jgi:adenine-specific DNA-methyltransferase
MYFQDKNALKIDVIRLTIESWYEQGRITDDEYFYLLASLISAVPFVSNIAGVYGAYLKHWDIRTYNDLVLQEPTLVKQGTCRSYNMKDIDLLNTVTADLLYADPPYNSRQYLPNYHVLETIARYDYPKIKGVTGMRDYSNQKSDFCKKATVHEAFENMIVSANVRYVMISYNSEGLLSTEELTGICKQYAEEDSFKLIEIDYRRYKNKQVKTNSKVQEQVYFFKKRL